MAVKTTQIAISSSTFQEMLRVWGEITSFHESGYIYLYGQSMVSFRYRDLIQNREYILKYFQGITPVLIDAEALSLEDFNDLEKVFSKQGSNNSSNIYFICNINRHVLEGNSDFFYYIKQHHIKNPKNSYLLFFSINILHPQFASLFSRAPVLQENTCIHPLSNDDDCHQFMLYLLDKWKLTIAESLQEQILDNCMHQLWLIKEAVRYIRDTNNLNIQEILHHEMMDLRVKIIYDSLLDSEKSAFNKIILGNNDFTTEETHSISFLKQTGWLYVKQNRLYIKTPLLAEYVEKIARPMFNLQNSANEITLHEIPITNMFSAQEQKLLFAFIKAPGKLLSRDDIARVIWGNSWNDKYSDWAIDQMIRRLRKKLIQLTLPSTVIKSIKGKGFIYDA